MSSKYGSVAYCGATTGTNSNVNNIFNKYIYNLLYNDEEYIIGVLNVLARINTTNITAYAPNNKAYCL